MTVCTREINTTVRDATRMILAAMARDSLVMERKSIRITGPPNTNSPAAQGSPITMDNFSPSPAARRTPASS